MNVQDASKQGGQTAGTKHMNRKDEARTNEHVSDKAKARVVQSGMDLTNGDPPALMLWGTDE